MGLGIKKSGSIVISLGDDGAIVTSFQGERLLKRIFVPNPFSTDFQELVAKSDGATIYLLLDTIDQNYVFSNLPAVGSKNIMKMVTRKLTNEFDKNDINTYLSLGKDPNSTRKDLKFVFISVRNASPVSDWLEVINKLPNVFSGIYLYPIEAEEFISQIQKAYLPHASAGKTQGKKSKVVVQNTGSSWEVYISHNRVGGFRQVVLKDKKIIFTRISQSATIQSPDSIGVNISQEAGNTLEYIRRIGFSGEDLSIYIVTSKDSVQYIDIPGVSTKSIILIPPYDLAQKLDLKDSAQEADKFGDVVFAANFLRNKKKKLRIVTEEQKKSGSLLLVKKLVTGLLSLIIFVTPIFALYNLHLGYENSSQIENLKKEVLQAQQNLNEVKDFEKQYGVNPDALLDITKLDKEVGEKDKLFFELIKKFKEADKYTDGISSINFEKKPEATELALKCSFNTGNNQNYGDLLLKSNTMQKDLVAALPDYGVTFANLPSDKNISVDVDKNNSDKTSVDFNITISTKK